ncbi:DddA-like double-stranded DNA deaminase toxin [Saccharothrix hoggarensis]|uniref:DddA-like double-stranded DNA deaminase toxin n=1 Tax=Saccharothrix hoggarensis TaxID=913853 RepID=A0ABW3QYW8_9PSEU
MPASLAEVAAAIDAALARARDAVVALTAAGDLADEAVGLVEEAFQGASSLEADAAEVVGAWTEVSDSTARFRDALAMGIARAEHYSAHLAIDVGRRTETSSEHGWDTQQRKALPTYVTSGWLFDEDGYSELVQSGRETDDEHRRIANFLIEQDEVPRTGFPEVAKHVEMKAAWRLRVSGTDSATVIVNNLVCTGPISCAELLESVLLPGQVLTVYDPVRKRRFPERGDDRELHP